MKRRALLFCAGALILVGGKVSAQEQKLRRIAYLGNTRRYYGVFRATLKELGYSEGRDIVIEPRLEARYDQFPAAAAELVALNPEVIVTAGSAQIAALKKATATIPIVFATAGDPVAQGFVASLHRPGGNITGVMTHSGLNAKIVEIAREALPAAKRLGIVVAETDVYQKYVLEQFEPAAHRLKFEPIVVRARGAGDLPRAFEELARRKADAAIIPSMTLLNVNHQQVAALGKKMKLPLLSPHDGFAPAGGLLSYGPPREESYRRAAILTDKILRGATPAELPVEQPERFQLVINRATAKAIGAKLSEVTMFRADRIID